MILTVTLNPAIDITYPLDVLKIDDVNRVGNETKNAGGKGLNVTKVLHLLGDEVVPTGIIGGSLGHFIETQLQEEKIVSDFYHSDKESRICIAIVHEGNQTEILEDGPQFTKTEIETFVRHYQKLLEKVSLVTISGSLPSGVSQDLYGELIGLAQSKGIRVLLDCSGATLQKSLAGQSKPYLIKPNETEFAELVGAQSFATLTEISTALQSADFSEIPWVVVTLGGNGAVVKVAEKMYQVSIPKIKVISPVGSGDATVAGFASGINRGLPTEEILKKGMTTGMLNTMSEKTGFIQKELFDEYYQKVVVKRIF